MGDRVVRRPRQRETEPVRIRLPDSRRRVNVPVALSALLTLTIGFASLILIGTVLLMTPAASAAAGGAPFIDALFTATSAVCVTGLVVVSSGEYWSGFGQAVLAALMFIGGLGIMTAGAFILLALGKRISFNRQLIIREAQGGASIGSVVEVGRYVILFAAGVQVVACGVLFARLIFEYSAADAFWQSLFHSVSAFNNAGFTIFPESSSLLGFQSDPVVLWTIGAAIILGAMSFPVVNEIVRRKNPNRWTLDTRLVLIGMAGLWAIGAAAMAVFELGNASTLGGMSLAEKISNGAFQATTARTAGFQSIDFAETRMGTDFLFMILMFVGGASGSVAGGIKINTAMVLMVATFAALRGRPRAEVLRREIPPSQVSRALALTVLALAGLGLFIAALSFTERSSLDSGAFAFADVMFETVSAGGTVGLSRGITPDLSEPGKALITLAMYAGRLGPLTIGLGLALRERKAVYRYAEERVTIG